jgi:Flp pilus assembly protein TadG
MVTAEFAMALPAFVIVVVAAVAGVAVVTAQLRCADAAAAAARLAARGESAAVIRTTALAGAPSGSQVSIVTTGDTVTATVRARIEPPGPLSFLPGVTLQAHVVDAREPSATGTMP